jgi:hypothetical protein
MQVITLQLPTEAVQSLLHVLGKLPCDSGFDPLRLEIIKQANAQIEQQTEAAARAKYAPQPQPAEAPNEDA